MSLNREEKWQKVRINIDPRIVLEEKWKEEIKSK